MTRYVMGIDGGGSTVRVAIVTPELRVCAEHEGPTANPAVVGAETAAATIRTTMRDALHTAHLPPEAVAGVGIGVAGAAAHHSADWLCEVIRPVTPRAQIVPSADFEIALVGAFGERHGALVLAGTGSLAYGVNTAGETALIGGWGYLLDDAGSGYWLGIRALKAVARAADGRGPATALSAVLLGTLNLGKALDLVPWLYHTGQSRTRDVAQLAPLVLEQAAAGDTVAQAIASKGAHELAHAVQTVVRRLYLDASRIAFAGGLLSAANPLSDELCRLLNLGAIPQPQYAPVIGAALLALNQLS